MTGPLHEKVWQALPADGSYAAFADLEGTAPDSQLFALLSELRDEGRAVLTHGRGWRRSGPEPDHDPRGGYMRTVADTVARCGHMVQYVTGGDRSAAFAYTVGLYGTRGFELVVTGALAPDQLQGLLNSAAALDPFPPARGVPQGEVMRAPYMAVLLDTTAYRCAEAGYPPNVARMWAELNDGLSPLDDFPLVQVVWPDADYRYPWHRRFAYHGQLSGQPLLGDPPASH